MRSLLVLSVLGLSLNLQAAPPRQPPALVVRKHLWSCTDVNAGPDHGYHVDVNHFLPSQRTFAKVTSQTKRGPVVVLDTRVVTVGPAIGRGFTVFTDMETAGSKLTLTINGNQKGGFTAKDAKGKTHRAKITCRRLNQVH